MDNSKQSSTCATSGCCPVSCCAGLAKGAVIGGIVLYLVTLFSWAVLPFHAASYHQFTDEAAVSKVLAANAPVDGLYRLPRMVAKEETVEKTLVTEEVKTETTASGEKIEVPVKKVIETKKPAKKAKVGDKVPGDATAENYAFVNFVKGGAGPVHSSKGVIGQAIMALLMAGCLTCILKGLGYKVCPAKVSFKIGLIAALVSEVPNVIWHQYPIQPALLNAADIVVGMTLAGIAIAQFALKIPLGGKGADSAEVWH